MIQELIFFVSQFLNTNFFTFIFYTEKNSMIICLVEHNLGFLKLIAL